jgi:alpha-1,2-mannosyltransferase
LGTGGQDRDRLGSLLVVQLVGLVLSPISWIHHWVWVVPLMIWLIHGPWSQMLGAWGLGWALGLTLIGVPNLLAFAQPNIWQISRPCYRAWAGLVYIAALLVTLGWIAATGLRNRRSRPALPSPDLSSRSRST